MPKTARDLIGSKQHKFQLPCKRALQELNKIFAHNDSLSSYSSPKWISRKDTTSLLESWGYPCSDERLVQLCNILGRASYDKK